MNWQETILTREQCIELWAGVDEDPSRGWTPFDDFQRIATAQAEASYKAGYEKALLGAVMEGGYEAVKKIGMKKAVEWMQQQRCKEGMRHYCPNCDHQILGVNEHELEAKLRDWSIAEGQ